MFLFVSFFIQFKLDCVYWSLGSQCKSCKFNLSWQWTCMELFRQISGKYGWYHVWFWYPFMVNIPSVDILTSPIQLHCALNMRRRKNVAWVVHLRQSSMPKSKTIMKIDRSWQGKNYVVYRVYLFVTFVTWIPLTSCLISAKLTNRREKKHFNGLTGPNISSLSVAVW